MMVSPARLCAAVAFAAMALTVSTSSIAAPADDARLQKAADLPNWDGVWTRTGNGLFDAAPRAARDQAPYKPEWAAKYRAVMAKGGVKLADDPVMQCLPRGMPAVMGQSGHFSFAVTPEQVWVFAETGNQTRRIYTDGRANLAGNDVFPTYTGNSVGHWEGDTLVVATVGLRDDMPLDRTGALLSGDAKVTERIRRVGPDLIEDRMVIDDPTALTKPWTVVKTYRREPAGVRFTDSPCHDHKGKLVVKAAGLQD